MRRQSKPVDLLSIFRPTPPPESERPRTSTGKLRGKAAAASTAIDIGSMPAGTVEIYTDGACQGNPGPGGWAATISLGGVVQELSGAEAQTTNNRMELTAAIRALEALKQPGHARVYTDSEYLRKGITEWVKRWKARGWPKRIKNQDLWKRLDELAARHTIEWHWVKGHSGVPGNERVDRLAGQALRAAYGH